MKEYSVRDYLKEKLKDPDFRELYEQDQQKLAVVKKVLVYRVKHKLSQKQLADHVGITQQHISKIENSDFSNIATLEKVLRAIGYSMKIQVVPLKGKVGNRLKKILTNK